MKMKQNKNFHLAQVYLPVLSPESHSLYSLTHRMGLSPPNPHPPSLAVIDSICGNAVYYDVCQCTKCTAACCSSLHCGVHGPKLISV